MKRECKKADRPEVGNFYLVLLKINNNFGGKSGTQKFYKTGEIMRTIMRSADFDEKEIVIDYPDGIGLVRGFGEVTYRQRFQALQGVTQEYLFEGVLVVHRDGQVLRELVIEINHDFPFFKMQFELEGHSGYTPFTKASIPTIIGGGKHQLFFFPEVNGRLTYPPGHRYTFEVIFSLQYLRKVFGEDLSCLKNLGRGVEKMEPVHLTAQACPITPLMKQIIYDFLNCPFEGVFRKVYLEAKLLELFTLQVDQLERGYNRPVSRRDTEKLFFIKEYLTEHPETACSLHELSELAGLNDFKLKRGFKALFQTTVFRYLTDVRMEKAKCMLHEEGVSIAEVAFSIGYKNPQHFTAAFKRKYGYLPSAVRC